MTKKEITAKQLRKRFSDEEVKMLLEKYLSEKEELSYLLEILGIKRRRFLSCLKNTKGVQQGFLSSMKERRKPEELSKQIERNITKASYNVVK